VEGEVLLELVDGGEVLLVARLGELLQRGVGAVDVACSSSALNLNSTLLVGGDGVAALLAVGAGEDT
jgi:hypothetical protein